ncbi:MAG: UvrB/UvrC motif-containing protein [Planctomycetota bacterium]
MTFAQFRETGLLGCPACYRAFEKHLSPLLERAHDGGINHIGKVPARAGTSIDRQQRIALLRRQLDEAITAEEYERAAAVRDELMSFEDPMSADHSTKIEDERGSF